MKNYSEHQKGLLFVFIAAFLWSSGGLLIKLITLSPMQISFFRCIIAAITFAVIFRKKILQFNKLTFLNSFFYAGVLISFVISTKLTTAANAIFLQSTAPIYVLIFEPLINNTRYEKINVVTIVICFMGMILFFIGEIDPGHIEGNLIALFSGLSFAAFFLGMKKNDQKYQQSSIFFGNVFVAIVCIPFLFSLQVITFNDLWMVTFLGVFQIAVAYAFFASGLKRIIAVEASIISLIEPVFNPVWVFLGYGEIPLMTAILGGIIILGVIVARTLIAGAPFFKQRFNN